MQKVDRFGFKDWMIGPMQLLAKPQSSPHRCSTKASRLALPPKNLNEQANFPKNSLGVWLVACLQAAGF
jgi:hypothetical protein